MEWEKIFAKQISDTELIPKIYKELLQLNSKKETTQLKNGQKGNFLVVQWLGLCTYTAEGAGSVPGQGTKIPQATHGGQKKKKWSKNLNRLFFFLRRRHRNVQQVHEKVLNTTNQINTYQNCNERSPYTC